MAEAWERQAGETSKQFGAFQLYYGLKPHERSVRKVQRNLGLKAARHLFKWSAKNKWVARAQAWDDDQARIRVLATNDKARLMADRHYNLADHMSAILGVQLQKLSALAKDAATREKQEFSPVDAALVPRWIKAIVDVQRVSLGEPIVLTVDADLLRSQSWSPLDQWRQTYVQPPGTFSPHRLQREAINDPARFTAIVAGVQSGKTTAGGIKFVNRIATQIPDLEAKGETGLWWLVAPNSVIGRVMQQVFEIHINELGLLEKTKGSESNRTWILKGGHRVEFRSAQSPESLVAAPVDGIWLDEFTLVDHRTWTVSLRQRLAKTGGWAIFTGTPRGRNWAYEEIWRRGLKNDDKYDPEFACYTWHSSENPAISTSEVASARGQLPEAYFRREWEASWEAFHGQIYEHWSRTLHFREGVARLTCPDGTRVVMGVDWGHANPGAAVICRWLPTGEWHVVEEVHVAGKLPAWWHEKIAELWRRWRVEKIYCDPAEPGRIATLAADGLPAVKANNALHDGIRTVAALLKQNMFLVDATCTVVANQIGEYHWKQDSQGNRREHPAQGNDHAIDGVRYVIHSSMTEPKPGERSTWGSKGKANRNGTRATA
ncbi:hypothetical protein LCGC14_1680680 [marine sediment metagenome]|uniref:Terminase large subunit gp17-like C-terminal domain-containing protein n=1 Tax=marine sediment metagenome TaxID=412755 RepID=A0A0F9K4E7_9ZZZZ